MRNSESAVAAVTLMTHLTKFAENPVADRTTRLTDRICELLEGIEQPHARSAATAEFAGWSDPIQRTTVLLRRLLLETVDRVGFWSAAVFVLDPGGKSLAMRLQVERGTQQVCQLPWPNRSLAESPGDREAFSCGWSQIIRSESPVAERWLPEGTGVGICHALRGPSGAFGTLWLFDRRSNKTTITPELRHCVESCALQVVSQLDRLASLGELAEVAVGSDVGDREHREMREAALLPISERIDLSRISGIEVAGYCESRGLVGGDLCEVIPLSDSSRTLLAVGDAAGTGFPASTIMSLARGSLHTAAQLTQETNNFLPQLQRTLNRSLCETTRDGQFLSLALVIWDAANRRLEWCNAGHPPPLMRISADNIRPLGSHGLLLGVSPTATWPAESVELPNGGTLAMFTDGITEARDGNRRMMHSAGIEQVLREHGEEETSPLAARIVTKVRNHIGDNSSDGSADDRTLLVCRLLRR